MPREEQEELALRAQGGDHTALERLVATNTAWIHKVSRLYGSGLEPEDAFQTAALGFSRAIMKFEPGRSSVQNYTKFWMRSELQAEAARNSPVRVWASSACRPARAAIYNLAEERGITPLEVLQDPALVSLIASTCRITESTVKSLSLAFARRTEAVSQNAAIDREASEGSEPLERTLERREEARLVQQALLAVQSKDERAARVLRRFLAPQKVTLEQLGKELGLSRERVRQIECRARSLFKDAYRRLAGREADETRGYPGTVPLASSQPRRIRRAAGGRPAHPRSARRSLG